MSLSAKDLVNLLKRKHGRDLYATEVLPGPFYESVRLDFWAMKRAWSNPCLHGYEIKVSRSDFLQDNKWHAYLPMCNMLSFVAPLGIIDEKEIPAGIGLLVAAKTGTRLYTKRKPHFREIDEPWEIYKSLLINRAVLREERFERIESESDKEYWKRWLEEKEINYDLGQRVGGELGRVIQQEIIDTKNKMKTLESQMDSLQKVREFCDNNDISYRHKFSCEMSIKKILKIKNAEPSREQMRELRSAAESLTAIVEKLEAES